MTLIRLNRIDGLFREADEVQDIKSDIDAVTHFNVKLDKSLKKYQG
jgi:hypothetical protein